MKLKSLLLCGLLVTSSSAFAALSVEERAYPRWADDPTVVREPAFDGATKYSIYNLGSQGFLCGANDWNTRASAVSDGTASMGSHDLSWIVTVQDAENQLYSLADSIQNARKKMFCNDLSAIWADNDNGENADTWQFTANEGVYTITNTAWPGKVLAVKTGAEGAADTRTYLVDPGTAGYSSEWIFSDVINKNYLTNNRAGQKSVAHNNAVAVYNASKSLWDLMKKCDAMGMEVSMSYQDAYAADTTSIATFSALVKELQAEYDEYAITVASLDNPVDVTNWFNANNGADNWKTIFTGTGTKGSNSWNTWSTEGNSDGTKMTTPFHETWVSAGNAPISDLRHQIDTVRVRPGVYRINARARCYSEVAGVTELQGAYLFANDFRTAFIDNSKGDPTQICQNEQEGLFLYNNMLGYYAPNANGFAIVTGDSINDGRGSITFGFYTKDANFNWVAHKDYKIEYLGNADDALLYVRDNSELTFDKLDEDTKATKSMVEDFNNAYDAYSNATTGDEVSVNYGILSQINKEIVDNMAAWAALEAAIQRANDDVINNDDLQGPAKDELSDEMLDYEDLIGEDGYELSTEEVKAKTKELQDKIENCISTCLAPGADVTKFLVNPKFDDGTKGWQGGVTVNQSCGEAYGSKNVNIYQDVDINTAGVYEISCQGFYRQYRMDNSEKKAWYNFFNSDGTVKVDAEGNRIAPILGYLYLNDNLSPLKAIFEEQIPVGEVMTQDGTNVDIDPLNDGAGKYWYANTMTTAAQCFAATPEGAEDPYYTVHAKAMLQKGDKMRIGIKASLGAAGGYDGSGDWVIFDNFKLKYLGYPADEVKAQLQGALDNLAPYLEKVYDAELKAQASELNRQGTAALEGEDTDLMFELAGKILALVNKIPSSEAVFADLKAANEEIIGMIEEEEYYASQEIVDEAQDFSDGIDKIVKGLTPATDSIAKIEIVNCAKYVGLLGVDDEAVGSDEEPIKYTSRIIAASFERNGKNSILGWEFKKDSLNNDILPGGITSGQTAAKAAEYYEKAYDMHQTIDRLPAGKFQVSMKGFFRHVDAAKDWAQVINDTASVATMYVTVNGVDTIFCPVRHLSADATKYKVTSTTDATEGTWQPFLLTDGDATAWHYPNNMIGSVDYFNYEENDSSLYDNIINVELNEGDVLTVGVKQDSYDKGDWFMMDNWQLMWYGTESSLEIGAQTSSCDDPIPSVTTAMDPEREVLGEFISEAKAYLDKLPAESERAAGLSEAVTTAQQVYDNDQLTSDDYAAAKQTLEEALNAAKRGDVNGDGLINSSDVVRLYEYMAGQTEGVSESSADVNGDTFVNSSDIVRIYEIMAGN